LEAAYLISNEELIVNGERDWVIWTEPPQRSVDWVSSFLPFFSIFQDQRNDKVVVLDYVESGEV